MSEEKNENATFQTDISFGKWILDFLNFKIMLLGGFTKIIYIIGIIVIIYYGFNIMKYNTPWGIIFIFLNVVGLHMVLELVMLLFSILDTLREIRDRLPISKTAEKQE